MTNIEINLFINPIDDEFSEFDLGNIEILLGGNRITSKNKTPDQSMMIWISICDLLDLVNSLLSKTNPIIYFVGAGSSFSLTIRRVKNDCIINYLGEDRYRLELFTFAKVLHTSAHEFYERYKSKISDSKSILKELKVNLQTILNTIDDYKNKTSK